MLLFFISSLLVLSDSLSLQKLGSITRDLNKSTDTSSLGGLLNSIQMVVKHKQNPKSLLKEVEKIDPVALSQVITLVEALLSASEKDLSDLLLISTEASDAYDSAVIAYNEVLAKQVRIDEEKINVDAALVAASAHVNEAEGAKTNAQDTYDTASKRLNGEIETLKQVIALLKGIPTEVYSPITFVELHRPISLADAKALCPAKTRIVSIKDVEHVLWLRDEMVSQGFESMFGLGEGVPLGYDYDLSNSYSDLNDVDRSVQWIFDGLRENHGYTGDYTSDQTSGSQHYAGFGWAGGRSQSPGIEDWSPVHHTVSGIICENI